MYNELPQLRALQICRLFQHSNEQKQGIVCITSGDTKIRSVEGNSIYIVDEKNN